METIEYRTIDKSAWPRGEWDSEPDKIQYTDEGTGLPCLIVRNRIGALCGYVGVSDGNPYFGKRYTQLPDSIESHCDVNYSGFCQPTTDESKGICHKPGEGEPDHVFWFGFDCAHAGDLIPEYANDFSSEETYKTVGYVKSRIRELAASLTQTI